MGCGSSKAVVTTDTLPSIAEKGEEGTGAAVTERPNSTNSPVNRKTSKKAKHKMDKQRSKSLERVSKGHDSPSPHGGIEETDFVPRSEPHQTKRLSRKDTPAVLPLLSRTTNTAGASAGVAGTVAGASPNLKGAPQDKPPAASVLHPTRKIEGTESQIEFFRKLDEKIEQGPDYIPSAENSPRKSYRGTAGKLFVLKESDVLENSSQTSTKSALES